MQFFKLKKSRTDTGIQSSNCSIGEKRCLVGFYRRLITVCKVNRKCFILNQKLSKQPKRPVFIVRHAISVQFPGDFMG